MSPLLATLVYVVGIFGLFYLNRDKSVRTSKALWIPVIYLWVLGSRPVSFWLGVPKPDVGAITSDGSPIDGAFFGILLIACLWVLARRGHRVLRFLNASGPILVYFLFCLLSVLWSDFPGVACKRWVKSIDDLAMVLVVLTDERPVAALSRLFSRVAFILLPLSLLAIKYFPIFGRTYDDWTGRQMYTGVTTDKNLLGVITFVLLLGSVWRVLALIRRDETPPLRKRVLMAQGTLLAMGIYVLMIADSVTSLVCFVVGTGLILATSLRFMRRHPAAIHALVVVVVVAIGSVLLLGGGASAAHALGRNTTLTGRTEIWASVIPLAANPVIGAGFESFWLSQSVHDKLWAIIPGLPLNEAHNGYIEVYLELGWIGVGLIAFLIMAGYRRAVLAFRRAPTWGGLLIAYTVCAAVYSLTEAGFRMMGPIWVFLLFAVVASGSIVSGVVGELTRPRRVITKPARGTAADEWLPTEEAGVRSY